MQQLQVDTTTPASEKPRRFFGHTSNEGNETYTSASHISRCPEMQHPNERSGKTTPAATNTCTATTNITKRQNNHTDGLPKQPKKRQNKNSGQQGPTVSESTTRWYTCPPTVSNPIAYINPKDGPTHDNDNTKQQQKHNHSIAFQSPNGRANCVLCGKLNVRRSSAIVKAHNENKTVMKALRLQAR